MNIYVLYPVADNPLFEGLALLEGAHVLDTQPDDWRLNYRTWQPRLVKDIWRTPKVVGNVRRFNDFPCINLSYPAFSQRAVDMLRDLLEPNGELLPVKHDIGTYYFYNCTRMVNCVDLNKSKVTKVAGGIVTSTTHLVFLEDMRDDYAIFKVRTQLREVFCTDTFVTRIVDSGLQGFVFPRIWPPSETGNFNHECYRVQKLAEKWKPKTGPELAIKGNTLVLRLYCERKVPSKSEKAAVEAVMSRLEDSLYDASQQTPESYYGNVEGSDIVDHEIRVFLSAPDCDRLVTHLMPTLKSLHWPGTFHVVKRRSDIFNDTVPEEYVPLI